MSTSALALGLSWPARSIVAECDPAGGDALAGFLGGQLDMPGGIAELAVAHARGRLDSDFWGQLVDLDAPKRERLLLPGVKDPADSGGLATIAARVAELFADLEGHDPAYDVIVDCGRLTAPNTLWPVLGQADVLALVVRGTLPSLSHAQAILTTVRAAFDREGWRTDGLGLLVVDEGPYVREAGPRLGLPVFGVLPHDPRTARTLSFGGEIRRSDRLIRAARDLHPVLRDVVAARRLTVAAEVAHVR